MTFSPIEDPLEFLATYFRKRRSYRKKKKPTVQLGDAFEDSNFKAGFEIVKFFNQVVYSLSSFSFLWNKNYHWLYDIELIQINYF